MEPMSEVYISKGGRLVVADCQTNMDLGDRGYVIARDLMTGERFAVKMSQFFDETHYRPISRQELQATFAVAG